MKHKKSRRQMPLFEPRSPTWDALPAHAQQQLIDVLSQLLQAHIDHQPQSTSTATKTEDHVHVS